MECEVPKVNASGSEIDAMLASAKTIAVVGLSPKPDRPSHWIAKYLMDHGYNVIGVNPGINELFGRRIYKALADVPGSVDIVDIFRQPDALPEIVDQAIAIKAKVIWMQEGIVNNAAADRARAAGLQVVMNKCIYKEHAGRGL